jgi:outer membrane protein OmpA-like peptidoglycan-associated protein
VLDTLAAVLKDPYMAGKVVRIEGHTDTTGSDEYNVLLSYRRAVAVQQYLRDHHGLLTERLPAMGKGKAELYDPSRPTDAVNRRVQFVNMSDSGGQR